MCASWRACPRVSHGEHGSAAAERRLLRLAESESSETLALGLTYYHNFKAQKGPRRRSLAVEGRLGVGCIERASCLLASPPGVGAPLLESCASAARPRDKASRRPSGKNSRRGARAAALGGVWQLGAAGCCKRRGTRSSPECSPVPGSVRCRGAPVVWRSQCSGRALSQRFAARNRAAHRTGRYPDETKTSGKRECPGSK